MTTLVVGASGATGKLLVEQLLEMGHTVKVIVRSSGKNPDSWNGNSNVTVIRADVSEISVAEMANYINDCQAVASCLGHNLNLKGIYGKPRRLVSNTVELLSNAITKNASGTTVRFVLMNTAGNSNRNLNETISFMEKLVIGLIRLLLPPHVDNENAADYLRVNIGQDNKFIEWVAVRPDTLIDEGVVTEYELYASPTSSALFKPGKTSRINVGNFMARLILENDLWDKWEGQMPVIYNKVK